MLSGFMQYIREPFDEECVEQFHKIVTILEGASGEDFSHFRIPPDKLKPRIVSVQRASYSGHPGRVRYSDKKDCDAGYFRSQVDGLGKYLPSIRGGRPVNEANPYDSLTDYQLQEMLLNRNIKPKRVIADGREQYVYDRVHAIGALLNHDRSEAPATPTHSTVINVHDSNFIHSSPGASITETVGSKIEELRKILIDLKNLSAAQELSPENRAQITIDIGTIELQINSSRPNPSVVRASLESAKAILEHAAGVVLGTGAIAAIRHYLKIP